MGDTYSNTYMPAEAYRYSELAYLSAKACGVFAGFDPSVLKAAFQIPSMPATYERKSRLKDSIARSSAKYKNQYLLFFR